MLGFYSISEQAASGSSGGGTGSAGRGGGSGGGRFGGNTGRSGRVAERLPRATNTVDISISARFRLSTGRFARRI